jgi:DNA-binding FadR family transcriptional regulator
VCVQALTEAIERGVYAPGSPLPSETDLADQLDVSRATLREALRTLEDRQLIIRRHEGSAAADDRATGRVDHQHRVGGRH